MDPNANDSLRPPMETSGLGSAYKDIHDTTATPRASPRPVHPAVRRERRASFDTASSLAATSSATSVSVLAAQQSELLATVNRLANSVESLSQSSVDPAQILELTDRLNMLSVTSPNNTYMHQRSSPNYRQQTPFRGDPNYQNIQNSRLNSNGRMGSFPAPAAYQHQQIPRRSYIPPLPSHIPPQQSVPSFIPNTQNQQTTHQFTNPTLGLNVNGNPYEPSTPWGEPEPVRHLLFTGKSNELRRFLVEIRDVIRPHQGRFMTDSRRINWVAQHFMIRDHKMSVSETASQNWFDSLLASNAQEQGRWTQFSDLKAFDYIIPELLNLENFYEALICNFEDKDSIRTANNALENFTQEKERLSISDFNAKWRIMASQTLLSMDSIIKLYEQNIHPAIAAPAANIERWVTCKTMDKKMMHSLTAAGMATQLSKLPNTHPFSTKGTKYASFPGMSQVLDLVHQHSHV